MTKKKIEKWRLKAIEYLEKSNDPEIKKAIPILKDGQGYLTSVLPIQIKFFSDIK